MFISRIVDDRSIWFIKPEYDTSVADSRLLCGRLMEHNGTEAWVWSRTRAIDIMTGGQALAVLSHHRCRFEASHGAPLTKHYRHMRRDDEIDKRKVGDVGGVWRCRRPAGVPSCVANNNTLWRLVPVASLSLWISVNGTLYAVRPRWRSLLVMFQNSSICLTPALLTHIGNVSYGMWIRQMTQLAEWNIVTVNADNLF